jgi:hypothetical protein
MVSGPSEKMSIMEAEEAIAKMKGNKAAGPSGVRCCGKGSWIGWVDVGD